MRVAAADAVGPLSVASRSGAELAEVFHHYSLDQFRSPPPSRSMILAVKAAGGSPRYSELEGVGHDSWTPAYRNPVVIDGLFAQRKGMPR